MPPAPALPGMTENVPASCALVQGELAAAGPPAANASAASSAPRRSAAGVTTAALYPGGSGELVAHRSLGVADLQQPELSLPDACERV